MKRVFLRSWFISSVISFCLIFGFFGMCKAYENTFSLVTGENRKAVEYSDGILRFFDLSLNLAGFTVET